MLLSIIMILAAIGAIVFFAVPRYQAVADMRQEEAQLTEALANARKLEEARQDLLDRYNSFESEDLRRLETMLPDNIDNVKLIIELDALAAQYSLPLQNVTVENNEETAPGVAVIDQGTSEYGIVQLQFTVRGPYERFVQFLQDLERSLRIIDVRSLQFQTTNEAGIYQYALVIETYWLK